MDQNEIILDDLVLIAAGGQSKIYLGRMSSRTDLEPINVIAKEINEDCQDLILKELRIKDIDHNNVIKVYGTASSPMSCIVLEYLEFGDLEIFIEEHYDLLKVNVLWKIKGMIEGIHHLHSKGILHLDLHPKNILVARSMQLGQIFKISDFGLSKDDSPDVNFDSVDGRPGYISPEKVRYGKMTRNSDIWSLGCILWKIFTKKEAFDHDNRYTIYYMIGSDMHPDVPILWPVQIQKLLFYCWDRRSNTSKLIKLFNVTIRIKKTEIQLKKEMPLEYEWRYIKLHDSRIVPPIIWNSLDKNIRFANYQFSNEELDDFRRRFGKHLCARKLRKIESFMDLLRYLNESGYFKDLKELNEKLINFSEMRLRLIEAVENKHWIAIARTLGMPDDYIDEIANRKCDSIVNEMFEFWSEERTCYSFSMYGLDSILQSNNIDYD